MEHGCEAQTGSETQSVPLIIGSTVDDSQKGLALGADAYAVKPIDRGAAAQYAQRAGADQGVARAGGR